MKRKSIRYSDSGIVEAVKSSTYLAQVLRKLGLRDAGGNYITIKKKIKDLNLDISHFDVDNKKFHSNMKPLRELLRNGVRIKSTCLKNRLIKEGVFENKCMECGQLPVWNGKPLVLELEHIDGDIKNNSLDNLKILCLHCHSQTDTFRRRKRSEKIILICSKCNAEISKSSKSGLCRTCVNRNRDKKTYYRKVENRPDKNILIKEVEEIGYRAVGKKYGVSDNAIRKWIK